MTEPRRPAAPALPLTLLSLLALGIGACTGAASPPAPSTAHASQAPAVATTSPEPSLTPVPGGKATPVITASPPGTTNVSGFGKIYDALPPSFPKLPGQEPADTAGPATSGSFVTNVGVAAATITIETALKAKGWAVDAGSPLEDGSVVIEASGPNACKAEIRFTPQSGSVIMSVLYGATCPYP